MGSRIIGMQQALREVGRLRTGTFLAEGKGRPVKSPNWVITSPMREPVEQAAELWGGEPEHWKPQGAGPPQWRVITTSSHLEAILPPGDPLSQAYEFWSAGGCMLRCNGDVARQALRDGRHHEVACVCRAEYGDEEWHLQPKTKVCSLHTRVNVLIPELDAAGQWRVETKSYYSAMDVPAQVDLIRGMLGEGCLVPITLGIEPFTRVRAGKTMQTQRITLQVRGAFRELLAGRTEVMAIGGGSRPALGAAPTAALPAGAAPGEGGDDPDEGAPTPGEYEAMAAQADSVEAVKQLWGDAVREGAMTEGLAATFKARAAELASPASEPAPATERPAAPARATRQSEPGEDAGALWMRIVAVAGELGLTTGEVGADFAKRNDGLAHYDAGAPALADYLRTLEYRAQQGELMGPPAQRPTEVLDVIDAREPEQGDDA